MSPGALGRSRGGLCSKLHACADGAGRILRLIASPGHHADLRYAAALASGQITGAEGEKFKAGKLGEYTIGKDGEVILGAPFVFKADNIDEFDF